MFTTNDTSKMLEDIYFDGRIYFDVTPSSFGRPDYWNTESEAEHNEALDAFINHIKSFHSYLVARQHSFHDFQRVKYKVNYTLWMSDENSDSYQKNDVVAIQL